MFWFGTIICIGLIEFLVKSFELGIFAFILMIFSIACVPYIFAKCNDVEYTNKVFLNKQGIDITNNLPKDLSFIVSSTILLTAFLFVPFIMLNGYVVFGLVITNFLGFILLVPTICFMYKNCPVSILFNKKFLEKIDTQIKSNNNTSFSHKTSCNSLSSYKSISYGNICTDSSYRGMSCNIYNRHHNK